MRQAGAMRQVRGWLSLGHCNKCGITAGAQRHLVSGPILGVPAFEAAGSGGAQQQVRHYTTLEWVGSTWEGCGPQDDMASATRRVRGRRSQRSTTARPAGSRAAGLQTPSEPPSQPSKPTTPLVAVLSQAACA